MSCKACLYGIKCGQKKWFKNAPWLCAAYTDRVLYAARKRKAEYEARERDKS